MENFFIRVYNALELVPKGKVVTYGQIAKKIGEPRKSRHVGFALHSNPEPLKIPCHRVVNRFGQLSNAFAFGGVEAQKSLLESEGVVVSSDMTVDLEKYQAEL